MYPEQLNRTAFMLLAIAMSLSLVILPCDAAKRRFSVADDIGLAHFGDPYTLQAEAVTFSPDGQYFAVDTERGLLDQDRPESTLRVYRTEDVHQFLLRAQITGKPSPVWMFSKSTYKDGPIITHIRWLADSSGVAFLVKTSSGNDELFLADLKTKNIHALTLENQHVTSFDIRDGKHFVYSALSPVIGEKAFAESQATSIVGTGRYIRTLLFPENLYPSMSRFHDLSELWAVVNGKRFRVDSESSGGPVFLHSAGQSVLALSPDGLSVVTALTVDIVPPEWETQYPAPLTRDVLRIRAGRQDPGALDGYMYVSEYVAIELSTGKVKRLTNAPIGKSAGWWSLPGTEWSSDGRSILLINTFLSSKTHDPEWQMNRPCVAVVDVTRGNVTCIEPLKGNAKTNTGYENGYRAITGAHFARGSARRLTIDYWGMDQSSQPTSDWSKKSTSYVRLDDGVWTVDKTTNGWTEQDLAIELDVKESFTDPPVLVATNKTTKSSRAILDPNPQLKEVDLGEASLYRWKDKNGRDWVGGLYKPPGYVEGQRYPLVVQTHGFSQLAFRPSGLYPTANAARELSAADILVLQVPDCPLTVDLEESSCNMAGYQAAVQQLAKDGLVNAERVGIVGFSRTCYYVTEALTMIEQHFKAASITDGFNGGYLQYIINIGATGALSREADAMIGMRPFGNGLQQWLKRSPGFNLDKVTAPLLVVGEGPYSLLFMWEPYAALRALNKPVDLIMLGEGTHVLTNPGQRMVSQGGTVDWFRFWLQGYEDPDTAKTEQYKRWRELRKLQNENEKKAAIDAIPVSH